MANYYTPIAVQQPIPAADLTGLERLLLAEIFDMQIDDDAFYFSSEQGLSDVLYLDAAQVRSCLDDPAARGTTAWKQIVDQYAEDIHEGGDFEVDASGGRWENILQDVVRRSGTLDHLSVIASYTCDKLRPESLGGMVMLITADQVRGKSTHELMAEFIAEAVAAGEMQPI
jgi:hypothetical protein